MNRRARSPCPPRRSHWRNRCRPRGTRPGPLANGAWEAPAAAATPRYQGFDRFYGYLCQRVAHNYYPTHLWDNHDVDVLGNTYFAVHQKLEQPLETAEEYFARFNGRVYAPDRMIDEALKFVGEHQQDPFFLYFATPRPPRVAPGAARFARGLCQRLSRDSLLGQKSYLPHPTPRAAYAAMISRMDADVGRLIDRVEELGLTDNTVFVFTSDNGPTFNGGTDSKFFESAGPLSGLKVDVLEGGISCSHDRPLGRAESRATAPAITSAVFRTSSPR